ncbi:MAG TPA: hypothetical protein PLB38_00690 [bacterium]|nr:hypothetical protein [bacterium]
MFIVIRFLIYTLPLVVFGFFAIIRSWPQSLLWAGIFMLIYLLFSAWYVVRHSVRKQSDSMSVRELLNYLVTPALLLFSSTAFLLFINDILMYRLLAGGVAAILFLFLENVFIYLYYPHKYVLSSLENVSAYSNLLTAFFVNSAYYGLSVFLHMQSKWMFAAVFIINIILFLQTMLINHLKWQNTWFAVLMVGIILGEMVWVLQYLTWSYLVKGAVLAFSYYLLSNMFRYYFLQSLNKTVLYRHILISLGMAVLILASALWL